MMPIRIQRRRIKGWRMPPDTIFVGRPSKWGNVFIVSPKKSVRQSMIDSSCQVYIRVPTVEAAVKYFEIMVNHPESAKFKDEVKAQLKGKNLACFCPIDSPCHADILLRIANEE